MLLRGASLRGLAAPSFCLRGGEFSLAGSLPHRRDLSILDHARLTSTDFLDLGGETTYRRPGLDLIFLRRGTSNIHFPSDTRDFLYYVPGPEHAPIAGEVRFRATPDPNPASFANGRDLLLPDKPVPWIIPLINMLPHTKCYQHLLDLLVNEDQVVSSELVTSSREQKIAFLQQSSHILHKLEQPIIMDFSRLSLHLRIASESHIYDKLDFYLPRVLCSGQGKTKQRWDRPYTGWIKGCLEVTSLNGIRGLALRVLEILTHQSTRLSSTCPSR